MVLMAAGLDPDRCILFAQSHVREHAELGWILSCVATMGELGRMTQFKDKARGPRVRLGGPLHLPGAEAADILLYKADRVPVGDDQRQHLELTRDIAGASTAATARPSRCPRPRSPRPPRGSPTCRSPRRRCPRRAARPRGRCCARRPGRDPRKLKRAVTDSGGEVLARAGQAGRDEPAEMLSEATATPVAELEERYRGSGYGAFKTDVAEALSSTCAPSASATPSWPPTRARSLPGWPAGPRARARWPR